MKLYTSLTRLKMEMNGGVLPPMTPLTQRASVVLDPHFSIGMGGVTEDSTKGLRCPVRGCGKWVHRLGFHANRCHPDIGGARGLRRLLDIPDNAPLISQANRDKMRALMQRRLDAGTMGGRRFGHGTHARQNDTGWHRRKRNAQSVGVRNLRDTCEAQLKHKFIDLQNKIGRPPVYHEFVSAYGSQLTKEIIRTYGTWNNAKGHFGLPLSRSGTRLSSAELLESLRAWYDAHGELPSPLSANRAARMPLLHSVGTYLRAFKTESWPEAMRRAASLLNIYGGKYGLPIEHRKAS